jgi:diguanylate cyclase (GGDEF)-like protein
LELKRARRYGYPVAVCLVAPDTSSLEGCPPEGMEELTRKLARAITSCIRDIDLPVDFTEERMLLFLPYTDEEGARGVGQRVLELVRSTARITDAHGDFQLHVSIGVAALQPGESMSFARLMRDANAALKAAQLKGGNQIVCRK